VRKFFRSKNVRLPLPIFFPDATRGLVKFLDTEDLKKTKTKGVLVNTFHLWWELKKDFLENFDGIRNFMNWQGGLISDSGGFQVMSLIKSGLMKGKITDEGIVFYPSKNKREILTPEKSIDFQFALKTDMVVVLDDFTPPQASYEEAKISVERTISWAQKSKEAYLKNCQRERLSQKKKSPFLPYILGVVQGGRYQDLRKYCVKSLVAMGFDGLGYGGWPINEEGKFDYESAETIAKNTPRDYFLYGLGVGKPEEIVNCVKLGFNIFDCVLPTRDARHARLYVYNATSIREINLKKENFYSFFLPKKKRYADDKQSVSSACDCLLCRNYSRAYLAHLFRFDPFTGGRLATIHNLRFYSLLMERLRFQHRVLPLEATPVIRR